MNIEQGTRVFIIHKATYSLQQIVGKLLKLPTNRFLNLKNNYVGNSPVKELQWNSAIIRRIEGVWIACEFSEFIESQILATTWNTL
jgi:hypothetical protein